MDGKVGRQYSGSKESLSAASPRASLLRRLRKNDPEFKQQRRRVEKRESDRVSAEPRFPIALSFVLPSHHRPDEARRRSP